MIVYLGQSKETVLQGALTHSELLRASLHIIMAGSNENHFPIFRFLRNFIKFCARGWSYTVSKDNLITTFASSGTTATFGLSMSTSGFTAAVNSSE